MLLIYIYIYRNELNNTEEEKKKTDEWFIFLQSIFRPYFDFSRKKNEKKSNIPQEKILSTQKVIICIYIRDAWFCLYVKVMMLLLIIIIINSYTVKNNKKKRESERRIAIRWKISIATTVSIQRTSSFLFLLDFFH